MLGLAQQQGHALTRDAAEAEVLVVNTCAFIDKAKQESIDAILEMAAHKKTGACRKLIVTGCLAERYRDELRREIPEIDAVLGTGEVPQIVDALRGSGAGNQGSGAWGSGTTLIPLLRSSGEPVDAQRAVAARQVNGEAVPDPRSRALPTYIYDADTPRLLATPRHYAYVKIAEGCDYKCAFCIIPTLRGTYRSRSIDSIVREAHTLAAQGVKELLLVSQDTSFYGIDRGERGGLARLLRALDRVDGIEWIRLLYLYPTTIGDDVLAAMTESEKVCRYVDLPLQHASDAVLKRMRRPGTRRTYEALLDRIRRRVPDVTLRTTFIVGFPGETAADFDELAAFVQAVGFDHVGVFTYSHEEGTAAHGFDDTVPAREKRQRRAELMRLQRRLVGRAQKGRIGREVRVMVDGPAAEHDLVLKGRLEGQAPDIDPCVYLTDCDPSGLAAGQFVRAQIVGSRGYDLLARPLDASEAATGFGLTGARAVGKRHDGVPVA
jgi:ribosomal protein S12 methylthiotransferase